MIKLAAGMRLFDRYVVLEKVRGGGQAFCFRGTDARTRENVFIKQYRNVQPRGDVARAMPNHFAALRERLKEKALYMCLPLDCGEDAATDSVIGIYPWIAGRTLRELMDDGISDEECVRVAMALTRVVMYLRAAGIAHLDLKPANVMVESAGLEAGGAVYVRLVDFDASRIDERGLRERVIGTKPYSSPEHCDPSRFGAVSWRSDVFSLGVMLFELMFKRHPFDGVADYGDAIAGGVAAAPDSPYHYKVVQRVLKCLAPKSDLRPTPGYLYAAMHETCKFGFVASTDSERWTTDERLFVDASRKSKTHAGWDGRAEAEAESEGRRGNARRSGSGATGGSDEAGGEGASGAAAGGTGDRVEISDGASFRRVYFGSVDIGRNELRGSKLNNLPPRLLMLKCDHRGVSIELVSDGEVVLEDGSTGPLRRSVRLEIGSPVNLTSGERTLIVLGKSFHLDARVAPRTSAEGGSDRW